MFCGIFWKWPEVIILGNLLSETYGIHDWSVIVNSIVCNVGTCLGFKIGNIKGKYDRSLEGVILGKVW